MLPYLGPPWTNSCQIWCVWVFHHVLLKYGHENAEMQKRKFDDVTLRYSIVHQVYWIIILFVVCAHFVIFSSEWWSSKLGWSVQICCESSAVLMGGVYSTIVPDKSTGKYFLQEWVYGEGMLEKGVSIYLNNFWLTTSCLYGTWFDNYSCQDHG